MTNHRARGGHLADLIVDDIGSARYAEISARVRKHRLQDIAFRLKHTGARENPLSFLRRERDEIRRDGEMSHAASTELLRVLDRHIKYVEEGEAAADAHVGE